MFATAPATKKRHLIQILYLIHHSNYRENDIECLTDPHLEHCRYHFSDSGFLVGWIST